MDRMKTNTHAVFDNRNATTPGYNVQRFYYNLMTQWYNCAYHKKFPSELRHLGLIDQEYDPTNPNPMPIFQSGMLRIRPQRPLMPPSPPARVASAVEAHRRYQCKLVNGNDNRPLSRKCFYCAHTQNYKRSECQRVDRKDTFRIMGGTGHEFGKSLP